MGNLLSNLFGKKQVMTNKEMKKLAETYGGLDENKIGSSIKNTNKPRNINNKQKQANAYKHLRINTPLTNKLKTHNTLSIEKQPHSDQVRTLHSKILLGEHNRAYEDIQKLQDVKESQSQGVVNDVTVNIYWIRHGLSCANIMKAFGMVGRKEKRDVYAPNSWLSGIGVLQAEKFNNNVDLDEIDLFCSSELIRAIQTALLAFKEKTDEITVLPWISEQRAIPQGFRRTIAKPFYENKDNIPDDVRVTKRKILKIKDIAQKKFEGNYLSVYDETPKVVYDQKLIELKKTLDPDPVKFKQLVLPLLVHRALAQKHSIKNIDAPNLEVNLAIVSHQKFIQKMLGPSDKIPNQ